MAAAAGARTVVLFGSTVAARYGLGLPSIDLQGLPDCPHRRPTAITEQVCCWDATCPLADQVSVCMADLAPARVVDAVLVALGMSARTSTGLPPRYNDNRSTADAERAGMLVGDCWW